MGSLKEVISNIFSEVFKRKGMDSKFGSVVLSQRADLGQFQCNGALAASKGAGRNPREIAEEIVLDLEKNKIFSDLSIAGPGFINIKLDDKYLADFVNAINQDERFGCPIEEDPKNIVIDFGSPNIAKPMHVGHLRSAIIGDSLQRLLGFCGHRVISDNHVGDWGTQMGILITELRHREPELPYFDDNYSGTFPESPPLTLADLEAMYPAASSRCKASKEDMAEAVRVTDDLQKGHRGYTALWKHFLSLSLPALKKDYEKLGIGFDYWLGESFYAKQMTEMVEHLKKSGYAVESDGAVILPVAEKGDKKEIPPVLLVKSGGGFLYGTSDMATIEYRMRNFKSDIILYVVDQRQGLHFEQIFRAVRKTKIVKPDTVLQHIGFGTVNGTDGKPFKTREGGVMKLSDLITLVNDKALERIKEAEIAREYSREELDFIAEKVGIAALKFADLMNPRTSNYIFDFDKFCSFEGKTGPYVLYAAVRIKSILRKAKAAGIIEGRILPPRDPERRLLLTITGIADVLKNAEENYAPHYICDFVYTLSQELNRFLRECHILRETDADKQGSWLAAAGLSLRIIEFLLDLLGIEIPERM